MKNETIFYKVNNGVEVYSDCFDVFKFLSRSRIGKIKFSRYYGRYYFSIRFGLWAIGKEAMESISKKIKELEK